MKDPIEFAAQRFAVFAEQVLEPAVFACTAPLNITAAEFTRAPAFAEAIGAAYQPIEVGWRWGPAWTTVWLRLTGRIPDAMAGGPVVLRCSTGTEALIWKNGVPMQGLDENHQTALLWDPAEGNEDVNLYIEAVCCRGLGVETFWWDESELRSRWREPKPGRLERCELAALDHLIWRLWRTFEFARELLPLLPQESSSVPRIAEALRQVAVTIDTADVGRDAPDALKMLEAALRGGKDRSRTRCFVIGHSHIDTAWLWPVRETQRKCLRTLSTALALVDRHPSFRFLHTQPQQYAWIQQQAPELYTRIQQAIADGRWEASGPMWVEPDCNLPSGESLVRQILYGVRYWREELGLERIPPYLYLPDTFGYPATLPQIMKLAGLDTFITNKMNYNEADDFPHVNFRWHGLDGTEVVAHCMPGRDYNCAAMPYDFVWGDRKTIRLDRTGTGLWLQTIGYGDGGGGPSEETIYSTELARDCEDLPATEFGTVESFCTALQHARGAAQAAGRDWPIWDGELYLQRHRGTLTTCGWLKRANRRAEEGLRCAEWLTHWGPGAPDDETPPGAKTRFDEAWRLLLLNQFHDILPGTSVSEVYRDAKAQLDYVRAAYTTGISEGLERWSRHLDTSGLRAPMAVFNPSAFSRTEVVACAGELHYVEDVPALGVAVLERVPVTSVGPVCAHDQTLSNGIISATIDHTGRISSLKHIGTDREACVVNPSGARDPLNQLVLYEDRPRTWEAWDIDPEYEEKCVALDGHVDRWDIVEDGPLRSIIEVLRQFSSGGHIAQRFILEAGSPRLSIETRVEWAASRKMLRALFPVDVRARHAVYDISLGHVKRPTHRNTSWDRAMFEVCAHRWMDLSEPDFGVALLNDCKYGHSCHGNTMGLTLLRSPKFPDPTMDVGIHEFTYSLMPHAGDWRTAGVDREAEALNVPLLTLALHADRHGALGRMWAPLKIATPNPGGVQVCCLKKAEGDDRLILRLAETRGVRTSLTITWSLVVETVVSTDLLERETPCGQVRHDVDGKSTIVHLRPFEILTLAIRCQPASEWRSPG